MARPPKKAEDKCIRVTVSIPSALKARMDRYGAHTSWSGVAAAAFAAKLEELVGGTDGAASLEDMAARLRGVKRRTVDAAYERGWRMGQEWAMRQADLDHLVLLERLCRTMNDEEWQRLAGTKHGDTAGDELLRRLYPSAYEDLFQRQQFWSCAGVEDTTLLDQLGFLRGFVEASLNAWAQVKGDVGDVGWWCPTMAGKKKRRR
jgi:hypothetical protein